jgi:uncharacterized protein (DUF983 family)
MSGYDQSIADVIRSTIHDAQDLVRSEIALAKAEMRQEVRRVGAGAALMAAAAVGALIALVFLLAAVAWSIPALLQWPVWTGFALVGALILFAAIVLAMLGRNRFNTERHMPLTTDTLKENMQWTRARKV